MVESPIMNIVGLRVSVALNAHKTKTNVIDMMENMGLMVVFLMSGHFILRLSSTDVRCDLLCL